MVPGLAIKASGAFATYLTLFLVAHPLIDKIQIQIVSDEVWTIEGQIRFVDENGKEIKNALLLDKVSIELRPPDFNASTNGFRLRLAGTEEGLPFVRSKTPHYLDDDVDPNPSNSSIGKVDYDNHIIQLSQPIKLQRNTNNLQDPNVPFSP